VMLRKKWLMAGVCAGAALAAAGGASAADLYGGPAAPPPPMFLAPVVYNWTGLYFGGHVGGAWGDVDWDVVDSPFFDPDDDPPQALPENSRVSTDLDGVIAGAHLGFNQQVGRFVFGFEASLSGADLDGSTTRSVLIEDGAEDERDTVTLRTDSDWLALATLRLGYTFDRWLVYLKGGYATANLKIRGDQAVFDIVDSEAELDETRHFESSERHHGWHIGAGVEYALPSFSGGCCNAILGLEYNFIDLDGERHIGSAAEFDDEGEKEGSHRYDINVDPDGIHTVKARLSFKFGCCEAVAAIPPPAPLK
jgi:outer membrane immunogenic protein